MRIDWAPHVIPCVAMLYLMRNVGVAASSGTSSDDNRDAGDIGERMEFGDNREVTRGGRDGKEASGRYGSYGSG